MARLAARAARSSISHRLHGHLNGESGGCFTIAARSPYPPTPRPRLAKRLVGAVLGVLTRGWGWLLAFCVLV
jgi:hypothetical protein